MVTIYFYLLYDCTYSKNPLLAVGNAACNIGATATSNEDAIVPELKLQLEYNQKQQKEAFNNSQVAQLEGLTYFL